MILHISAKFQYILLACNFKSLFTTRVLLSRLYFTVSLNNCMSSVEWFSPFNPGHFYAPGQPGQCVLSLGSDQTENNILISGDTTGCLQMWDISSYALDIQHGVGQLMEIKPHCVLHRTSASAWCVLFPCSQLVSDLPCCSVGGLMQGRLYVWKFWRKQTDCLSSQHRLMVQLDCGQRTAIVWVILDRRWCGISQIQLLTAGERNWLVSIVVKRFTSKEHKIITTLQVISKQVISK